MSDDIISEDDRRLAVKVLRSLADDEGVDAVVRWEAARTLLYGSPQPYDEVMDEIAGLQHAIGKLERGRT